MKKERIGSEQADFLAVMFSAMLLAAAGVSLRSSFDDSEFIRFTSGPICSWTAELNGRLLCLSGNVGFALKVDMLRMMPSLTRLGIL